MSVTLCRWALSGVLILLSLPVLAKDDRVLELIDRYKIADPDTRFTEPSGLVLVPNGEQLVAVSDNTHQLYWLTPKGAVLGTLPYPGELDDLEGIALRPDGMFLVVEEARRRIVVLDSGGARTLSTHPLSEMAGYRDLAPRLARNPNNKGLEGITVDPQTGRVLVVFERTPRLLVEISADLSRIVQTWELPANAGFVSDNAAEAELDISGLAWDSRSGKVWMVSDEGRSLYLYNLEAQQAEHWPLAYIRQDDRKTVKHAEGVALDPQAGRLFIVTDAGRKSRLYVFALPERR